MPEVVWYSLLGNCELCHKWLALYSVVLADHDDRDYELWCGRCMARMASVFDMRPAGQNEGPVRRSVPDPRRGTA